MRRCVACVSSDDRHLLFELDLVFDWLVLLFESALDSNGIFGLSVVRVKISTNIPPNHPSHTHRECTKGHNPSYLPYSLLKS